MIYQYFLAHRLSSSTTKPTITTLALGIILTCFSCGSKKESTVRKEAKFLKSVQQFADTVFFQHISDIEYNDDRLFFSDLKTTQIISCDFDFENPKVFTFNHGRGPLDLYQSTQIGVDNQHLIINDARNKKFIIKNLQNDSTYAIPNTGLRHGEFSLTDNIAFMPYTSDTTYRVVDQLDFKGKKVDAIKISSSNTDFSKGSFHTFRYKEYFIIVPVENHTLIQVRNAKTNALISETNIAPFEPLIENSISQFKSKGFPPNASLILFEDVSLYGNNLFLLLSYYDEKEKPKSNRLLNFSIQNNGSVSFNGSIQLRQSGWYEAIEVISEKKLVAFEYTNTSIELYEY